MRGLLDHDRLSIGIAPISSRFVESESESYHHFSFIILNVFSLIYFLIVFVLFIKPFLILNFVLLFGTLRWFQTRLNLCKDLLVVLCILFDVFPILIALEV